LRDHFQYVCSQGFDSPPVAFDLIALRDALIRDHYFLGLVPLVVIAILFSGLIWRYCPDPKIPD